MYAAFHMNYTDILQEIVMSLVMFFGKFVKVYVVPKLLKYSFV